MADLITPRVARIHLITNGMDWHTTATGIDKNDFENKVFKAIADLATLADAIAFILSIWAPVGADSTVVCAGPVGDLHALADNIKAKYPTGFIPATPGG